MQNIFGKILAVFIILNILFVSFGIQPVKASGIVVNTAVDENNTGADCSLREAITAANTDTAYGGCPAGLGSDAITFAGNYTITLSSQLPAITTVMSITGNGSVNTIIQANANPNTATYRVLLVNGGNLTLDKVTVRHGRCYDACEIRPYEGAGISNYNGSLTVMNSTIYANAADIGSGGGLGNYNGTVTVINTTFSGNSADYGGGIFNSIGTMTIKNSTLSGNVANTQAGGIYNSLATLHFANTIIANSTGVDCFNSPSGTIGTNTNNLIEDNSCSPALSGDPALGSLADNGGSALTHALLPSSIAIGAGANSVCDDNPGPNNLDQRGLTRPQGTNCDIGAYESNAQPGPTLVVNTNEDSDDGLCDLFVTGITDCTLREAINYANGTAGIWDVTFAANYTITLSSQLPAVTGTININGNGITNTIIQANANPNIATYRVFEVGASGDLALNNITVRNGRCDGSCSVHGEDGGGIYNAGTLSINYSLVSENAAPGDVAGGLYNEGGTVTITASTFANNTSYNAGGGILSSGIMTISNSTIANNSSTGNSGGGIFNEGILKIYNSTISGNTSNSGVFEGDNIFQNGTSLELYNTIIANSTDHGDCGVNSGSISATNSLIESTGAFACGLTNGSNGNIIGSDPNLGSLTGFPTYFPLNAGSPAINTGNDTVCTTAPVNNTSQNGATRPIGLHCDIGAVEAGANITVNISAVNQGTYTVAPGSSKRVNYAGVDAGPVVVDATNNVPIIAALREAYYVSGQIESFVQLMGLPAESLSTTYYFPAYNNVTLDDQLRFGNVGNSATTVTVTIAGVVRGTYNLNPGEAKRVNYAGLDAGPVVVQSSGGVPIIAALRDAYYVDGRLESFAQLMGLPQEKLSTKYYFPAYNNVSLDGQLRFGNVGNASTTVTVTIAGVVRGTYILNPSESKRVNYVGLDAGPVVVESSGGVPITAALRDAYFVDGKLVSFVQLMGLPQEQLSTTYNFPAYNNVSLDGQLRFGNVGNASTTVTVTIAGVVRGTYNLNPSEAKRVNYVGLDAGPVVIQSSGGVPIIAALRDAYFVNGKVESFAQLMGLPQEFLSSAYYFPAYNNVTLDGQLRFGVP